MNIIPKLSLNKHPKDCDQLSLVDARNIKVTNDLTLISNEEDLIINNVIEDTLKEKCFTTAYEIVGCIPCNNELVLFVRINDNNSKIFRYNENLNECKLIYNIGNLLSNVYKIKGTFTYNVENNLIIAASLLKDNNEDSPLRVFNLGDFNNIVEQDIESYKTSIIPEVKIPNIYDYEYIKGNSYKGWYYFYVRYKIDDDENYTQWYDLGKSIFLDEINRHELIRYCFFQRQNNISDFNSKVILQYDGGFPGDGYCSGCYDSFSNNIDICNNSIKVKFENLDDRYKNYQLGIICSTKKYTKCWITNDITITTNSYIINNIHLIEYSINELLTNYNNYFNVGNIINYKNRLYISNYKESSPNQQLKLNGGDYDIQDNINISLTACGMNFEDIVYTTSILDTNKKSSNIAKNNNYTNNQFFINPSDSLYLPFKVAPININLTKYLGLKEDVELNLSYKLKGDSNYTNYTYTDEDDNTHNTITSNRVILRYVPYYSTIGNTNQNFPGGILIDLYHIDIKLASTESDYIKDCVEIKYSYTNIKDSKTNILVATNDTLIDGFGPLIYTQYKRVIDSYQNYLKRFKYTTLIPGEIYNFFIHFVDKYGNYTNGYKIENNYSLSVTIKNGNVVTTRENVVPIKLDYKIQSANNIYIFANEIRTIKQFINEYSKKNISLYNYDADTKIYIDIGAMSFNDILPILNYQYNNIFNNPKYDDIIISNIFNTGYCNYDTTGNVCIIDTQFGVYYLNNNEKVFRIPEKEFTNNNNLYYNYTRVYYQLQININNLPDGYIGYFISQEKLKPIKKVTGVLSQGDCREVKYYNFNAQNDTVGFNNFPDNDSANMFFYSSKFDIADSISLDYNILKLRAISGKYINRFGQIAQSDDKYGFENDVDTFENIIRNSSIQYPYNLNKGLVYTTVIDKLYGIDNYKLCVADDVKNNRVGLGTTLQLDNIKQLFKTTDDKETVIYLATLYNIYNNNNNNNNDNNSSKELIRITGVIYPTKTIKGVTIKDNYDGCLSYDGIIVYNNSGFTFNAENNKIYKQYGKFIPFVPDNSKQNVGYKYNARDINVYEEGILYVNEPFLQYLQFPVIDNYFYESKVFNNEPTNIIFSVIPSDVQDETEKYYYPGYIIEPKNSIDLFSNPQGSRNDFAPTIYNNYRNDLINIVRFDKTVRRSNVIQDESRINAWRQFPVEGYKNINENKGIITNLVGIGVYILVHTEHSLFMFNGDATLKTQDKSLQLEQPDAFDTNYIEVFTSDLGFGGLQDDLSFIVDQFGYIFYNNDFNRFYKFDNGQLSLIDQDIHLYIEDNKPTNVRFANDKYNNRLLIKMIFSNDKSYTLSYNYELGNFISFHDYTFEQSFNTKSILYLLNKKLSSAHNNLFNFTKDKSYGTYENISTIKTYPSTISIIINENYDVIKFLEFIKYNVRKVSKSNSIVSISPVKESIQPYAGDILEIFSEFTNTGEININVDTTNKFNRYFKPWFELGNWNFNYFRNKISTYAGNNSDKLTRIYGNYIVIKFTFDNKDKCCIEFENLTGSVSKQRKL